MEDKYRGLLARYHDHELSAEAARDVELHLAGCAGCRAELAELRALSAVLNLGAEPVSSSSAEAFWQTVQPRLGPQRTEAPWRSWLPGLLLLALQAVLGVVGLLLALASAVTALTGYSFLPGISLPFVPLPGLALPVVPLPGAAVNGLLSTAVFASAGVLYLVWLAAWWSRSHSAARSSKA